MRCFTLFAVVCVCLALFFVTPSLCQVTVEAASQGSQPESKHDPVAAFLRKLFRFLGKADTVDTVVEDISADYAELTASLGQDYVQDSLERLFIIRNEEVRIILAHQDRLWDALQLLRSLAKNE